MDTKELQKCREDFDPIPWGFWKLAVGIIAAVGGIGAAILLWQERAQGFTGIILWCFLIVIFGLAFRAFVHDLRNYGVWPYTFIRDYWRRNVIGYEMHYWREPEKSQSELQCQIYGPDQDAVRCPIYKLLCEVRAPWVHVVTPLGGWFNRPRLYFSQTARQYKETVLPHFSMRRVLGERDEYWLKDAKGGRVRLHLFGNLFCHMERLASFWRGQNSMAHTWEHYLWDLLEARSYHQELLKEKNAFIEDWERRLCQEQKRSLRLGAEAQTLRDLLRETIKAVNDTKRFGRSKEAKEIRERLEARLKEVAPAAGGTGV